MLGVTAGGGGTCPRAPPAESAPDILFHFGLQLIIALQFPTTLHMTRTLSFFFFLSIQDSSTLLPSNYDLNIS